MYFVGVDIAKSFHVASVIDSFGVVHLESFSFDNNHKGFSKFIDLISSFPKEELLIGLESTAHYGEVFAQFVFNLGFKVAIVNPLQTSAIRKAGIRKTKTDKVDSLIVAKALILDNFTLLEKKDIITLGLRSYARARRNLVTQRTKSKIQLVAYADQIFPELEGFFKNNLHINTAYQLLLNYTMPTEIAGLHLTKLTNLLKNASRGHFNKETAIALKELAKNSVGIYSPVLAMQVRMAIEQILFYDAQIEQIERECEILIKELNSVILTIPGISTNSASAIIGVIGEFNKFESPKQLVAFAGLDPVVYESGNFKAISTRMSKRGNSLLRQHLILTAHNVVRNNQVFKQYYDKKRAEGKNHYNALGHCATKLLRVIFKLVKENKTFNL